MRTRIPHLPQLIRSAAPAADLVPDRALLAEFVASKSGIAFELLVRRHGPAVWAVCRRHLANAHDAEDAFQATFLVLAKSAGRIAKHASVGGWLYGVAYRVALKARRTTARRKRVEAAVAPAEEPTTRPVFSPDDTTAVVHAELEKLPDRYRLPVLLCDLEGLSRKEASAQLGWSEGTLSGRLSRARKLLAGRLTGRGVAAAVVVATATAPPSLATTTAAVAVGLSVFGTPSSAITNAVATLAHGAMRDMTRSLILKTAGVLLAASVLLTGGLFGLRFDAVPEATAAPVPKAEMAKAEDITESLAELLGQPSVQRELKLSAEQRVALIDGFERLLDELQKSGVAANPLRSGGQAVPPASDFAAWEKYETGVRELVAGTVTKAQLRRLQQCEVQVLGLQALRLKRVQAELDLTADQTKAVASTRDLTRESVNDLPQVGALPPNIDPLADVVGEFTAAQQKKWKELNGEPVGFNKQKVTNQCPEVFSQLRSFADDVPVVVPPPAQPLPAPQLILRNAPPVAPPAALPDGPGLPTPPPAQLTLPEKK